MAELLTAVRYQLPVKVVVCNNGLLGQILWEQMALGYPRVRGAVPRSGQFRCLAINAAFDHLGPALVDVVVNPDEHPMPAKVTWEQAKGFAESFLHGQPHRTAIVSTLFRDKFDQPKGT